MKRPLRPEELRLWGVVAATVRPAHGRPPPAYAIDTAMVSPPLPVGKPPPMFPGKRSAAPPPLSSAPSATKAKAPKPPPGAIEPGRHRLIARERHEVEARLDLHGLDQDAARRVLHAFVLRAQAEGYRAVLVITGKGSLGDGILRRRTPEWLAEPAVRAAVAGIAEAHRRHGGAGALYVALKRRT